MEPLAIHIMANHTVVCNGAMNFSAWPAAVDRPGKHKCLDHKACSKACLSKNVSDRAKCTSTHWLCIKMSLLIALPNQSQEASLALLMFRQTWIEAKTSTREKSSLHFWAFKYLVQNAKQDILKVDGIFMTYMLFSTACLQEGQKNLKTENNSLILVHVHLLRKLKKVPVRVSCNTTSTRGSLITC